MILENLIKTGFSDNYEFGLPATIPPVNIEETDKEYRIEMAIPGLKKEDFDIDIENNFLLISGSKELGKKDEFARREFNYSAFSRSFILPKNLIYDEGKASYINGILYIVFPKSDDNADKWSNRIIVK